MKTRKSLKILIISFFTFIILNSCNNETKKNETAKQKQQSISNEKANNIFKDLVGIEPIYCIITTIDSSEYIICLANKTGLIYNDKYYYNPANIIFYKLSKFANAWQIDIQKPLYNDELSACTFFKEVEIVTIQNKQYLYFIYSQGELGNAVSYEYLNFNLYSINDLQLFTLTYEGTPIYDKNDSLIQINGEFSNIKVLKNNQEILKFFEKKAAKSTLIYRPTEKDLDINNVNNFDKKWHIDNSNIKNVWDVEFNIYQEPLKTTYYDKSIFPSDIEPTNNIENNRYKIISFFRGNILGYDKIKKKYFPIWLDECSHGCDKSISFIDNSTLQITYIESNDEIVTIDLEKLNYSIILN